MKPAARLPGQNIPGPSRVPLWHYGVLAILPALLSALNPNWEFQNLGHMDPWYYFGSFMHFPRMHSALPSYPAERVLWILPGYALVHLFGQIPGVVILHWMVFLACVYLLHYILLQLADSRSALIGAVLLGCNPFFIGANGWDYPEGLMMACLLLSLALVTRRPSAAPPGYVAVFLSGAAWAGLLNTYLGWVIFLPAYFYVMVRMICRKRFSWRAVMRAGAISALGGTVAALVMWGAYRAMGGQGFFFSQSIHTAVGIASTGNAPWVDPNWFRQPAWLAFPALAACLAVIGVAESLRRRSESAGARLDLFAFYLCSVAAMAYMTIPPRLLLAFDYKASILVPAVFLTFGLVLFRVPESTAPWQFYLVAGLATATCLVPLARVGLYQAAFHRGFLIALLLMIVALATVKLWVRPHPAWWAAGVALFAAASFGLVPATTGTAWRYNYRGADISERVARSVRLILKRTPEGRFPVFWYQDMTDRLSAEFRGVMCSFITHNESMKQFPKVDKQYRPGTPVFVLLEQRNIAAAATYRLARAGMAAALRSQDRIEYGDTSYWITQLEIMPMSMAAVREGFEYTGTPLDWAVESLPVSGTPAKTARWILRHPLSLPAPGVYQFELRYRKAAGNLRFGAVQPGGGAWLEESGAAVPDGEDRVAWFRIGVKAGVPVLLAAEAELPFGSAKVSILRDRSAIGVGTFNALGRDVSDGNLIPKGGFETGLGGWDHSSGTVRFSSDCYSGGCVEFLPFGKGPQYLVQWNTAKVQPGKSYELSAWIRSGTGKPLRMEYGMWDATPSKWIGRQDFTATAQWTNVKLVFLNSTRNDLSPMFWESRGDLGSMFVDEVELQEVGAGAAPSK